jgi:serine/threonine-protein kinase
MPSVRLRTTAPAPGEVIADRYVIERVIAEGGFGIVVAAKHLDLEEMVAIKFLKPESAASPEVVGRFAREAKICARMKSEHTPTVIDVGVSPERGPYMVMEYLEGEDLLHVIARRGAMPVPEAAEIALQACEALASAHAAGVIHRDVKPENLFLARRPHGIDVLKVLDFGISKATIDGQVFGTPLSVVRTQSLVGTPHYMSPEQLRGRQEVGPPADLWSLGAVIYELVAGRGAFSGLGVTEVCASVLETEPPRLDALRADVPRGFADAIARCLAKKVDERFASAAELAIALAPFAPARACIEVERAVAVSRQGGLLEPLARAPALEALEERVVPMPPGSLPSPVPPDSSSSTATVRDPEDQRRPPRPSGRAPELTPLEAPTTTSTRPAPPSPASAPRVEILPTLQSVRLPRDRKTIAFAACAGAVAASAPVLVIVLALLGGDRHDAAPDTDSAERVGTTVVTTPRPADEPALLAKRIVRPSRRAAARPQTPPAPTTGVRSTESPEVPPGVPTTGVPSETTTSGVPPTGVPSEATTSGVPPTGVPSETTTSGVPPTGVPSETTTSGVPPTGVRSEGAAPRATGPLPDDF